MWGRMGNYTNLENESGTEFDSAQNCGHLCPAAAQY